MERTLRGRLRPKWAMPWVWWVCPASSNEWHITRDEAWWTIPAAATSRTFPRRYCRTICVAVSAKIINDGTDTKIYPASYILYPAVIVVSAVKQGDGYCSVCVGSSPTWGIKLLNSQRPGKIASVPSLSCSACVIVDGDIATCPFQQPTLWELCLG
jgi:hypothetical protein